MQALRDLLGRRADLFWNGIAGLLPRAAMFAAGVYVARFFGGDAFVYYSLGLSTTLMTGGLAGTTLTTTGTRFLLIFEDRSGHRALAGAQSVAFLSMGLAVALAVMVAALASPLARLFGLSENGRPLFLASATAVLALVLHGGAMAFLLSRARFRAAALAQATGFAAFATSLPSLCAWAGPSGALLALGLLYATGIAVVIGAGGVPRGAWPRSPIADSASLRELIAYFIPLLVATGLAAPVVWVCNLLLVRTGAGRGEIAAFNVAYNWFAVAAYAPAILAQVEFIHLSRSYAGRIDGSIREAASRFRRSNILVLLPLTLVLALVAEPLVAVFGQRTPEAASCLRWMLLGTFLMGAGDPARLFLSAIGRVWDACWVNVAWGTAVVATAYLLHGRGALGVGYAFALGFAVYLVVGTVMLRRRLAAASSGSIDPH